ncbi:hypothetical protein HK101_006842 [Irineochytrium annulatum]|nr:hypothetical protein HK101_006842 [Irineochytrium annulatum]
MADIPAPADPPAVERPSSGALPTSAVPPAVNRPTSAGVSRSLVSKSTPRYVQKMDIITSGRQRQKKKCDGSQKRCERNIAPTPRPPSSGMRAIRPLIMPSADGSAPAHEPAVTDGRWGLPSSTTPGPMTPADSETTFSRKHLAESQAVAESPITSADSFNPMQHFIDELEISTQDLADQPVLTPQSVGFVRPSLDPLVMMLSDINPDFTAYIPFPDFLTWPDSISITPQTLRSYFSAADLPTKPARPADIAPPPIVDVDVDVFSRYFDHHRRGSPSHCLEIVPAYPNFLRARVGLRYVMCAIASIGVYPPAPEPVARRYFLKARHFLIAGLGEADSDGMEGILQLQALIWGSVVAKNLADMSTGKTIQKLVDLWRAWLRVDDEEGEDALSLSANPALLIARRKAWRTCLLPEYVHVLALNEARKPGPPGGWVRIAMPDRALENEDRRLYWLVGLLYLLSGTWDTVRASRTDWWVVEDLDFEDWQEKMILLTTYEVELEGCRRAILRGGWRGTFDGDEIRRSVDERMCMGLSTTLRWDLILPFAAYHGTVCLIALARSRIEKGPQRWETAMKGERSAMAIVNVIGLILKSHSAGSGVPDDADDEVGSWSSASSDGLDGAPRGTLFWDATNPLNGFVCFASSSLLFEILEAIGEAVENADGYEERFEEMDRVRARCRRGMRTNLKCIRKFAKAHKMARAWEKHVGALVERADSAIV